MSVFQGARPAPLEGLTIEQLRSLAASLGCEVPKGAKKADVVALIEQRRG